MVNATVRVPASLSRHARGQALIWLLGTLAASAAVLYAVFNVSQLTVGKQRAVNAADAAALAGANVEARLLNLVAYNNRAIVANEAFLIQMLSIESWLQYLTRVADNMGYVSDVIGIFVPPVEALAQFLHKSATVAEKIHGGLVKADDAVIVLLEGLKKTAGGFHEAVLLAGGALAEDAANSVVSQNRTAFKTHQDAGLQMDNRPAVRGLTFIANEKQWLGFTHRYTNNERGDARAVLLDSRDRFSASRPGRGWMNADFGLVGTEKNGGSKLAGFTRWETQDTFEIWEKVPCKAGMCKTYQPIGWGRSTAANNEETGDLWEPRRSAQQLARSKDPAKHKNWSGVPSLFDIKQKLKDQKHTDPLGLDFVVAVQRPLANTLTTQQLGMGKAVDSPAGSAEMNERLQGDSLAAIGKARVSFERPQRDLVNDFTAQSLWRADRAKEYGSLYSPYWQARLVDVTAGEKLLLVEAMGIKVPDAVLYTPGGQK
jgi:hypothetical protein